MAKHLVSTDRAQIVAYRAAGKTAKDISKIFNKSLTTVSRTIKKYKERATFLNLHKKGRKKSLNSEQENIIVNLVKANHEKSLRTLSIMLRKNMT